MTYWRLFYHVIWATRERRPLITEEIAPRLHGRITTKAELMGAVVHCAGGTEDHVHLVVSVPPTIAIAEFTRQVKGATSHFANHELSLPSQFGWQSEYGVVSFDGKLLDKVVQYVRDQKAHHRDHTTIPVFERTASTGEADKP
ncbi:MAG TPA: IS200/IS605 family transposase [Chloroflexota bacterium]